MHILWINEVAKLTGGCERYVADTVKLLAEKYHTKSTLLYAVEDLTEPEFTKLFDYAFPMVDLAKQIAEINPDIIYVQRLEGKKPMQQLLKCGKPVVRFFHDHKLFCLREHKYTVIGHNTCTKPIGWHCYPCLGFINKSDKFPNVKLNSLAKFKAEQHVKKQLSAIVVGSDYMKQHLLDHGFNNSQILVNPLYTLAENKADNFSKRDILLFVGQVVRGKGIDILLHALKQISEDLKLVICGSGVQEAEFKALATELGVDGKVDWVGKVPKEELDAYYRRAICLVMPSRVPETFGLTGLEAMSYGTAVIASNVGGIPQWLDDDKNGLLVPSNDYNKLAEAMNKLIKDPKLATAMGKAGLKDFEDKFKPEFHVVRLYKLFEQLMR